MTNTTQDPPTGSARGRTTRPRYSLEGEAELENWDRKVGREYLPMDVFVGPTVLQEHFQNKSVLARGSGMRPTH